MKGKMNEIQIDKSKHINFSKYYSICTSKILRHGNGGQNNKGKKRKIIIKPKRDKVGKVKDVGIHRKRYIRC